MIAPLDALTLVQFLASAPAFGLCIGVVLRYFRKLRNRRRR